MSRKNNTLNHLRDLQQGKINLDEDNLNHIQDEIDQYIKQKPRKKPEGEESNGKMRTM